MNNILDLTHRFTAPRTQRFWTRPVAELTNENVMPHVSSQDDEKIGVGLNEPAQDGRDVRVQALEDDLITQIGRAAAQGLIAVDLSNTRSAADMPTISPPNAEKVGLPLYPQSH